MVYKTWCMDCVEKNQNKVEERYAGDEKKIMELKGKIRKYIYIGETCRSVYKRGFEHRNDISQLKTSSQVLRHILEMHGEEEDMEKINFGIKVLKYTQSSFERQILESVLTQGKRGHHLLNSRAEYNRCAILRLVSKMGEKEIKKGKENDSEALKIQTR